jgi:hypothetical protein
MEALLASVDHMLHPKHSEAVAEAGGEHHKLGHPKIIVHLGNTISMGPEGGKKNPGPGGPKTPPPHGPRPPKPTPGDWPTPGGGVAVTGHHPEGMMRCARCSCIYTECQCGKSRQVGMPYCPNPNTADVVSAYIDRILTFDILISVLQNDGLLVCLGARTGNFTPGC